MSNHLPTVSLCMFIHNEMHILPHMLFYEMRWADQVCIIDMASTDGLKEFCESALRPQDVYVRRERNTCALLGFAEAKNAAISLSTSDFAYFAGANSVIDWTIAPNIKHILKETTGPVLRINTINVKYSAPECYHTWERDVKEKRFIDTHEHRNFIRKGSGIDIKGYIHEEPHLGEENARNIAEPVPIVRYHFNHPFTRYARQLRYSWMFRRLRNTPSLQKYTHSWWWTEYYDQNRQRIEDEANQYEILYAHEIRPL
ncbi:MAG TPA: hypothetical protein PLC59_06475 [Bacteroidales bacterium]|nr:hypothetical protein [Bacteroidales bacterium]